MQEQASRVEPDRVETPQAIVEGEREPRQRLPVAEVKGGQHPAEMVGAKPAYPGVDDDVRLVVEVDETVPQARDEDTHGCGRHDDRRCRRARWCGAGEHAAPASQMPPRITAAAIRATRPRGAIRTNTVVRLFMVPFTSTPDRVAARTA